MTETRGALVTGASSGIGLAITQRLLQQGYRVVGISRRGRVDAIASASFSGHEIDLADLDSLDCKLGEILQTHRIDCFVHAAGQGHFGSIEQFSIAQMEQSIRVNLLSGMVICRALVPRMRRSGHGRMVFIGSESALRAGRKGTLYSAAKFGLRGFCQALRDDVASDGIHVSLVNPGMVRSPFFDKLGFAPGAQPENAIEVGDVADAVLYLLQSSRNIVIDEINLSARVKSIDFKPKP